MSEEQKTDVRGTENRCQRNRKQMSEEQKTDVRGVEIRWHRGQKSVKKTWQPE